MERFTCRKCTKTYKEPQHNYECPSCGGSLVEISFDETRECVEKTQMLIKQVLELLEKEPIENWKYYEGLLICSLSHHGEHFEINVTERCDKISVDDGSDAAKYILDENNKILLRKTLNSVSRRFLEKQKDLDLLKKVVTHVSYTYEDKQ